MEGCFRAGILRPQGGEVELSVHRQPSCWSMLQTTPEVWRYSNLLLQLSHKAIETCRHQGANTFKKAQKKAAMISTRWNTHICPVKYSKHTASPHSSRNLPTDLTTSLRPAVLTWTQQPQTFSAPLVRICSQVGKHAKFAILFTGYLVRRLSGSSGSFEICVKWQRT